MRHIAFGSAALLLVWSTANAGFTDSFKTNAGWSVIAGKTVMTQSVGSGLYRVQMDSGSSDFGLITHTGAYSTFTYSVSLKALGDHRYLGLAFCFDTLNFEGYLCTVRNDGQSHGQYSIDKMVRNGDQSSTVSILSGWNSFINPRDNALKVSKSGAQIRLFCNDVFIDSISDTSFSSGCVGMVLGPSDGAAFDQAEVVEAPESAALKVYYHDDFSDGDINGWRIWSHDYGNVSAADGAMLIDTFSAGAQTMVLTNGQYRKAPMHAILSRRTQDTTAFYGLMFLYIQVEIKAGVPSQLFDAFVYKISGSREYEAYYFTTTKSTRFTVHPPNASLHGTSDTLDILPDYRLVVNGDTMTDIEFSTQDFPFNAVGIIVDSNAAITLDDFSVGDSAAVRILPGSVFRGTAPAPRFSLGGAGIIYDVSGRTVGRFYGRYDNAFRDMGAGTFVIIPDGASAGLVKRAVMHVR